MGAAQGEVSFCMNIAVNPEGATTGGYQGRYSECIVGESWAILKQKGCFLVKSSNPSFQGAPSHHCPEAGTPSRSPHTIILIFSKSVQRNRLTSSPLAGTVPFPLVLSTRVGTEWGKQGALGTVFREVLILKSYCAPYKPESGHLLTFCTLAPFLPHPRFDPICPCF